MAQAQYFVDISNEVLDKRRRITGRTRREVEFKAAEQLQRWSEQEVRQLDRDAAADACQRALRDTEAAQAVVAQWRDLLRATLDVDDRIDWDALDERVPFPTLEPSQAEITAQFSVPVERPVLEKLRLASRTKRQELEAEAAAAYRDALQRWQRDKEAYEAEQGRRNQTLHDLRSAYEAGDREAVEQYISLVLAGSALPPGFPSERVVGFDSNERVAVLDGLLPAPEDLPTLLEVRYVASRRQVSEKHMKQREAADFYEDVAVQAALRTLHEVFEGDYAGHCASVVFNGVVRTVDRATGRNVELYVLSVQASRDEFLDFDLSRVEPRSCFRQLGGVSGAELSQLAPVRPIRRFDKEDLRFIEASNVLDGLETDQNLMTMDWLDFEMLVRDLFEKLFEAHEADVRVTRSSRDRGIDAVVFDSDPLTGGKIVIQAKRYRNAVRAAAVRELYGAMTNESAGKGILVTTSHFGVGARDFAKDKPITLIDGADLLHFLQNHGHHVRIDLAEGRNEPSLLEPRPL
jgi:restriction system protein